jgi:uracil-DNA glycosylase
MNTSSIESMFMDITSETASILMNDKLPAILSKISEIENLAPIPANIFRAFALSPIERTKVCIVGQDPFPKADNNGVPYANGLAFSCAKSAPIQASTKNIYTNLIYSGLMESMPDHGDLSMWAKQGVLLLNTIPTTEIGKSAVHKDIWGDYTGDIIDELVARNVIFICFGTYSKKLLANKNATVFCWGHPSPVNRDNNGDNPKHFKYNDTFVLANKELVKRGLSAIDWNPDADICVEKQEKVEKEKQEIKKEKQELTKKEYIFTDPDDWIPNTVELKPKEIYIFTDGAATKNGKANCRASFAYYITEFNANDVVKFADIVPPATIEGEKYNSSNNRGELCAIKYGIEYLLEVLENHDKTTDIKYIFVSDSEYSINCITKWAPNWYKNPTKHKLNEKKNLDLIKPAIDNLAIIRKTNKVIFRHIKSHTKAPVDKSSFEWFLWNGNDIADKLCANLLK